MAAADRFAGRFVVERELGAGGMGRVLLARDEAVGDRVALKLLSGVATGESSERFRREVRLARRISHPNVARIHDLGEHEGQLYLSMELVEGEDVGVLLGRKGRLSAGEAARIGAQIARGLEAAHAAGVLHRDLKPSNVLLERASERVVLTDFGVSRPLYDEDPPSGAAAELRTGGPIGTPAYMAPEQLEGDKLDARCDLYALGVMLYELVTGVLPFAGKTPMAAAMRRLEVSEAPDPSRHCKIPAALGAAIRSLLARRREARPSSAREVAEALEAIVATLSGATAPPLASAPVVVRSGGQASEEALAPTQPPTPHSPLQQVEHRLAVLPFRVRGEGVDAELARAMGEELVDVLSATRGLSVIDASIFEGETQQQPARLAERLGVATVLGGVVQRSDGGLRLTARLTNCSSGQQLWSERFHGDAADVWTLAERMARRVAETLRLELAAPRRSATLPADVAEDFLRARRLDRLGRPDEAVALLERALERVPDFAAGLAALADFSVHAYFVPDARMQAVAARAEAWVARALEEAPQFPETHVAAATLALQRGDIREAADDFRRALEQAPTYTAALLGLGGLETDALHVAQGLARIEAAFSIAPSIGSFAQLIRVYTLTERPDDLQRVYAEARTVGVYDRVGLVVARLRSACWTRDLAALEALLPAIPTTPTGQLLHTLCRRALGQLESTARHPLFRLVQDSGMFSPRTTAVACMQCVDVELLNDDTEAALQHLERLGGLPFTDLLWLDRCELLAPLRDSEPYRRVREMAVQRVSSLLGG